MRGLTTNACLVCHQAIKFLRYTPLLQVGTQSYGVEVIRLGGKVSPFDLTLLCRIHLLPVAVAQEYGLDLTVEKLSRLRVTGVESVVVDQKSLVL